MVGDRRSSSAPEETVRVPRLWTDEALAGWATPLAGLGVPPGFVGEKEYYAAPVDNLRTYPVYHPDREPKGYRDLLRSYGARPLIEPEKLKTKSDWIAAGRRVFEELDTAVCRTDDPTVLAYFSDAKAVDAHRDAAHDAVDKDGVLLDYRWVVDKGGKMKMSLSSRAGCHTRLMPDGSLLRGAPSNFDLADSPEADSMLAQLLPSPMPKGQQLYEDYGVPWRAGDVHARFRTMSDKDVKSVLGQENGAPPGTMVARVNGSPFFETRMADLREGRMRRLPHATRVHEQQAGPRRRLRAAEERPGDRAPHDLRRPRRHRQGPRARDAQGNRLLQGPVAARPLVPRALRALGLGQEPGGLVRRAAAAEGLRA